MQDFADGSPAARVLPGRADLGERHERKAPLRQARMRKDRIAAFAPTAAEVEDVDVDLTRAVDEARSTPNPALDGPNGPEERPRGARPRDLDNRVPEVRLLGKTDGLGSVEGRDFSETGEARDLAKGGFEVSAAISNIRAEAEVRERRSRLSVSTLLPPRSDRRRRSPRLPRDPRPRRALLLRRPRALHRTRWCSPRAAAP
jgi:hypothetical protein